MSLTVTYKPAVTHTTCNALLSGSLRKENAQQFCWGNYSYHLPGTGIFLCMPELWCTGHRLEVVNGSMVTVKNA